jgi:hypothetical protein
MIKGMENEKEIFDKIESLRQPIKCNKFIGAMTTEVIRETLTNKGFNVSERDSFIKGVPNEIDLMITKKDTLPIFNSYYNPEDVLFVFEIKYRGIYGKEEIDHIKTMFENVRKVNPKINCVYLTIYENKKHPHRATLDKISGEVFELFSPETNMTSAIKKQIFYKSVTGDLNKLIKYLKVNIT